MNTSKLIRKALDDARASLDEQAGKQVLSEAGIAVPKSVVVTGSMELPGARKSSLADSAILTSGQW
jgi:hypothetical protein